MYPPAHPPSSHLSDSSKCVVENNDQSLRLYQVWKGNNRFLLGGRLVFGPDIKSLLLTLFLILTPVILFLVFVSKGLVDAFPHHLGRCIVVLCAVLTTYTVILLFLTSGRDPGIIPRNPHPPEPDDEGDMSSISTDWAGSQSGAQSIPLTKNVMVNGVVVKVKYCRTCMLYRPPRCSHCSICNNCVERFDHHCPWVGQCIGRRNYRFFFMFVSSTTLLCLYVFVFCWVNIKKIEKRDNCDIWKALFKSPVSGVLIVYTFIVAWFVGGLTTFHLYLIFTNQTTYENFRYRYDRKNNPYNLGCSSNVKEVFFSRIPRSKHNFRAKVKFDSSSVSTNSSYYCRTLSTEIHQSSFELQIGGKRQAVNADDIEGVRNQIASGGLQRCGTHPSNSNWDHRGSWEVIPNIHILTAEYEMALSVQGREKSNGGRG